MSISTVIFSEVGSLPSQAAEPVSSLKPPSCLPPGLVPTKVMVVFLDVRGSSPPAERGPATRPRREKTATRKRLMRCSLNGDRAGAPPRRLRIDAAPARGIREDVVFAG